VHGNLLLYIIYVLSAGIFLGTMVIAFRGLKARADDPRGVRAILWLPILQFLLVALILGFSAHGEVRPFSTADSGDNSGISDNDVDLLMDRANHLEGLIVGSLLGFFITASAGAFVAARALRGDRESPSFTTRQFFGGITLVYAFVSGFYYFMLAQYYTTMSTLLKVVQGDSSYSDLTKGLQIPTLGLPLDPMSNVLLLLSAPLFPLAVSLTLTLGMYLYLRHTKAGLTPRDLTRAMALHAILCPLLVCHAFALFLAAGPLGPKGTTPRDEDREETPYSSLPTESLAAPSWSFTAPSTMISQPLPSPPPASRHA
jgi:hypothetical protein